jgi:ABC-type amino acid transport substrate-binding protein/gamma-glutamylcyclotransferase (GGCT)/AIG2-like uncharacterized protein YtfP
MIKDHNSRSHGNIRASLNDALDLISEYPRLALPVGVVLALFVLATVCKTLIDGFGWAYSLGETVRIGGIRIGGFLGVGLVGGIFALASAVVLRIVKGAIAARPTIQPLPIHCLSRSPIVKWEYKLGERERHVSYELHVRVLNTDEEKTFPAPERMYQIAIPDTTGALEIWVNALIGGRRIGQSRAVRTEIYRDSVQRIRETGALRVAVHTDPAEEIFCYYRDGRWQGLDMDFATLIAAELQEDRDIARPLKIEYSFFEWPAIIGAPNGHEVDMAIASISISAERSKKYGVYFSVPYAESKLGAVAYSRTFLGAKFGEPISLTLLKGKTVAIHKETVALAFMEKAVNDAAYADIDIQLADNNDELRELLRDNSVDAVVHDYYRAFTLLDEAGMAVYKLDCGVDARSDQYGIAFSRVNMILLEKVDTILKKHQLRIKTALVQRIEDKGRAILAERGVPFENPDRPAVSGIVNLFVYGSLMYEQVWRRLVSGEFACKAAHLSGYRRRKIKDEDYPGLVRGIGTVHGIVWLGLDEQTLRRIDEFEASCYRRISGVVIDDAGAELLAEFFVVKESDRSILEEADWDPQEFESSGLSHFLKSYAGFKS